MTGKYSEQFHDRRIVRNRYLWATIAISALIIGAIVIARVYGFNAAAKAVVMVLIIAAVPMAIYLSIKSAIHSGTRR